MGDGRGPLRAALPMPSRRGGGGTTSVDGHHSEPPHQVLTRPGADDTGPERWSLPLALSLLRTPGGRGNGGPWERPLPAASSMTIQNTGVRGWSNAGQGRGLLLAASFMLARNPGVGRHGLWAVPKCRINAKRISLGVCGRQGLQMLATPSRLACAGWNAGGGGG
jgi:hypothetical protein